MLLDGKTSEDNHRRFVQRVADNSIVFYLSNEEGVATSVSNEDEETTVLPFWSDRAYAQRAEREFEENFDVLEIDLFDFLYRWLPGMTGDNALAGTNWNGDLCGHEIDPFELRTQLEEALPQETLDQYERNYKGLVDEPNLFE